VDRYRQFVRAMQAADPDVKLYACGAPVLSGKRWNDTLIAGAPDLLRSITDHPLIGGDVAADADPLDVFRDFMAVPQILEQKWAALCDDMSRAGIRAPHLAVTELQMFAKVGRPSSPDAPRRLHHDNLVNPATHAEGLYDVLLYHSAVRLAPFVEMVTHSATVNHGGGLRKSHERVWANPCHYAQTMFATLAESCPVETELTSPTAQAPLVLPELRSATKDWTYKTLDVLAAQARDGSLLLSIVHKGTAGPTELEITLEDFRPATHTEIQTLAADVPWAQNTLEAPARIAPVAGTQPVRDGTLTLMLRPYSYTLVRLPGGPGTR
jgi:alpha-N-arabinofuranosidase